MKLLCISLGCDKNLVDAERMLGSLSQDGYTFTDDEQEADVILVNTCCFINDAKEESVNTILEMAEYKKSGTCKALLVSGCMAQRYKEEILQEVPEVDGILGTTSYDEVSKVLAEALKGERVSDFHDLSELPETKMRSKRLVTTGGHYAFLKISEGCNKRCTYCIIPSLRGPYRSVPMEQLLAEAKELADQGVKELILVAQETTLYGVDLYGEKTLPKLLHELAQIDGIEWIRIQYCYPEEITEELIQAIKTEEKVCHYLDIPIQHASDAVLKRMGRRTNQAELRERIAHLREEIPDIALRTTLISGFPGETQEDHEELMRFVDEMEFDRLGVFAYSAEEDTPAAGYPDQVPQEVKEDRRDEIMELQQKQLKDTEKRDKYKVYGELLNTYGYELTGGEKELVCTNYYTGKEVKIPLDPQLTARENSQKFFDKYGKLKRTFEAQSQLIEETKQEIEHLESISTSLDIALKEEDLTQIKQELTEYGFIKKHGPAGKKVKITSRPFHYLSSDGFHIYVGKNNYQNEELTFKIATGNDWWFHAKGIPGSHVIVKSEGKELPDRTFEEAAGLAAYYSKGRENEKVEIDYVQKKQVKKVAGAAPGFVIYHTNYSMMATPSNQLEELPS